MRGFREQFEPVANQNTILATQRRDIGDGGERHEIELLMSAGGSALPGK